MNGGMVEAQQGSAVLNDVDYGTLYRFAVWAYYGYYSIGDYYAEDDVVHPETTVDNICNHERSYEEDNDSLRDRVFGIGTSPSGRYHSQSPLTSASIPRPTIPQQMKLNFRNCPKTIRKPQTALRPP